MGLDGGQGQGSSGESVVESGHAAALSKLHLHTPPNWEEIISKEELHHLLDAGDQTGVHVVAGDIRGSTLLMREAISSREYATIATSFAEVVLKTAQETSGWFDRFTGDGFIVYWIYGRTPSRFLREVIAFSAKMHSIFEETFLPHHRKNARNLPAHVGLSLGIDSGRCSMEVIAGDFTMIGHAVVGAVRMVDAAKRGETLCNIRTAQLLLDAAPFGGVAQMSPTIVRTKEYPDPGQEAYMITFRQV
jgi:class 3 adenylate cyclase